LKIADHGLASAARADPALARGINTYAGNVTYEPVAEAHKMEYVPISKLLA
jgi:alanine dehydrogenase